MVLTKVMPRYGTREHQRLGILLVALLVLAVFVLMPQMAFAAFDGKFVPDTATQSNVDSSFAAWWRFIAVPGLWLSLGGFVFSVLFMRMAGWYIPLALAAIFMFGEMAIKGVRALMGT